MRKFILGSVLAILMVSTVGCVYDYDRDHYRRYSYSSRRYDPYYNRYYYRYDPYYARRYDPYYYHRYSYYDSRRRWDREHNYFD
jgi:hypothetical protein